jgi:hypothetical protein
MNRVAILTSLVGVAALFTFKRRWMIVNFAISPLKKRVFVPYHVAIIWADHFLLKNVNANRKEWPRFLIIYLQPFQN